METVKLKNSELIVSRLCMGGCPMGGHGWGETNEKELIEAVHTAIDCGINFFDTADTYGLGQSEITLGKALGNKRKDVVIATKFGVKAGQGPTTYDNSPAYIREAVDKSLQRLGIDYIDLYQIHNRDNTPIEEVIDTLEGLKKDGKIRYYGASNVSAKDAEELLPYRGKIVSFQDEYSLACRKNEEDIFSIAKELDATPMSWGSLGQGILTGKYDKSVSFDQNDRRSREIYVNFHGDKLLKNLEIVEAMKPIAAAHDKSLAAVAIRFILDYIPQSVVLCGAKRPAQVISNAEGNGWELTSEELKQLDNISK